MASQSPIFTSFGMQRDFDGSPYNRSPVASSSLETRCDQQFSQTSFPAPTPYPVSPTTSTSAEDDDEQDQCFYTPIESSSSSYVASEFPFAKEPALETELETELPPLKELRPTRFNNPVLVHHNESSSGYWTEVVRGILVNREPYSPLLGSSSPGPVDLSSTVSSDSSYKSILSSEPLSRRTSSNSSNTFKTVRFATTPRGISYHHQLSSSPVPQSFGGRRYGYCESPSADSEDETEPEPVAVMMCLTHSSEAYDRTSIVVEKSLRIPPRQVDHESGRWIQYGSYEPTVTATVTEKGGSMINDLSDLHSRISTGDSTNQTRTASQPDKESERYSQMFKLDSDGILGGF